MDIDCQQKVITLGNDLAITGNEDVFMGGGKHRTSYL